MFRSKSGRLLALWFSKSKVNTTNVKQNNFYQNILNRESNHGGLNQFYRFQSNEVDEVRSSLPQHIPTKLDRLTLVLTKTIPADKIGDEVSHASMEKANSRRRIGINIFLLFFTGAGAMFAMYLGKRDSKTQNVYIRNVDRYKEEAVTNEQKK